LLTYKQLEELLQEWKVAANDSFAQRKELEAKLKFVTSEMEALEKLNGELTNLLLEQRNSSEELITKYREFLQRNEPEWLEGQVNLNYEASQYF